MRVRGSSLYSFRHDRKTSRRGFTLVEIIVVLTILAILAAVGVVSLVGYINKSHYDENSRNAVTVYQAAQNAIAAKTSGGTIDEWTQNVMQNTTHNDFTSAETAAINDVNDSYHKTIALTYNPRASRTAGSEDQVLYDLLSPYFYDPSVFNGTMTVEFDVSITLDADGDLYYTARVISAYYSKQNTGNSGWDAKCLGDGSNAPLPQLEPFSYRNTKSFVGYFDGSEASITGPVTIPNSVINEDYVFELRNGETLDITWGFFDDPNTNATFDIRLHDEEASNTDVIIKVNEATLIYDVAHNPLVDQDPVYEYIKYESGFATWTKLTKQTGFAQVSIDNVDYVFPLTITHVENDLRNDTPDEYTTYTISIDCLMTRAAYDITNATQISNQTLLSKRLFGTDPRNISAHLENGNLPGASISESYATRAVDDPVYFTGIALENEQIRYCYDHTAGNGREINGHCVVNTLYGDLICTDIDGSQINGSFSGASGGKAVITSYRHLSNMRIIGNVSASFKIARNLDWYTKYSGYYFSEVKVFYSTAANTFGYHSPVENGSLKIVSFPAIKEFDSNKTLSSLSHVPESGSETVIYSINGVQMRNASFVRNTDKGYGLICENKGTVYNIYTNNLNLVLYAVNDGSNSDYSGGASNNNGASICPPGTVTINTGGSKVLSNMPCGGLIGLNNGTVGNPNDSIANGYNTIRMSNCIVMSSQYWKIYDGNNKNPCGGIIGLNKVDKLYGLFRVDGTFAVVSRDKCGGILGESEKNIGARFVISDVPFAASDFTLPKETRSRGQNMSCAVVSKNIAGGAIGQLGVKENSNTKVAFTSPEVDVSQGIYTIDVTLPQNSLIMNTVGYGCESAGGAIGYASGMTGDLLAIRVNNYGNIIVAKTNANMYCGGVIGLERDSSIVDVYINAYNHSTSRIGYHLDTTGPNSSGGVYGGIRFGTGTNYHVNVTNEGTILARGEYYPDSSAQSNEERPGSIGMAGTNGAGGFVGTANAGTVTLDLVVTNRRGCNIVSINNNAGGAFGCSTSTLNGSITVTTNSSTIKTVTDAGCNVGGAFGKNGAALNANVVSTVELNSVISSSDSVGGAIGYNNGNTTGSITANVASSVSLTAPRWVGGAIGYNDKTMSGPIIANMDGTITGVDYLGGVIGASHNTISGDITGVINGNIVGGTDSRILAGGIGHNNGTLSGTINITLNGNISGTAENASMGGFIGLNNANISGTCNITVSGNITDTHSGALYVSGGIGYNNTTEGNKTITGNITVTIQNGGYVSGAQYIGGCLGYTTGKITGTVKTIINSDNAIRGNLDLGGCIGCMYSGPVTQVSVECNTAVPIMQLNPIAGRDSATDTDLTNNEARIGGVIGYVYNGTIDNISLSGSGGQVSPGYPPKTYYNSMWINGGGCSVGGVIGQISQYNTYTAAIVKNITVDNVGLVVTSSNNSNWIGGWVGSCFGQMGTGSNNRANYTVNTVKCVYSRSDRIGGFCGILSVNGTNSNNESVRGKVYANITMNFSGALVSGYAELGGIFGFMNYGDFNGDMIVNLMNGTRLGDYYGTVDAGGWGMNTESLNNCFCIEVGGAVGYATNNCNINGGRIAVQFFDTSMLYAGGTSKGGSGIDLVKAGVGGAFGSLGNGGVYSNGKSSYPAIGPDSDTASRYVSVVSTSSRPCIYSAVTNTGGLVGYMYCGVIKYAYSTAVVFSATQTGGTGATGGLVGYMNQGYINHCYVGGHTMGGSYVPGEDNVTGRDCVGGFVGYTGEDTYIDECYTTASVRGNQYVGGFVGNCNTHHYNTVVLVQIATEYGEINTTYCTGRVTGNRYTGMYAGFIKSNTCVKITGDHKKRNKVLRYINPYNAGLNLVGADDGLFSDANNMIYFADPGRSGQSNSDAINVNGGTYPCTPYDPYLQGSSGTANFPFRAFIGGTHYGDWPLQPGTVDISPAQISVAGEYVYNGSTVTIPADALTVNYQGVLTQGTDYYVSYLDNDAAGTATVRIHGINTYIGMATATFEIAPANIEEDTFAVDVSDCFYSSSQQIVPDVSVVFTTDNGQINLVEGRDYTVEYDRELDSAGPVTATITGIGNYTGTVTKDFMINAIDLSDPANNVNVTVAGTCDSAAADTTNLGITVTTGTNNTLTAGTDYSCEVTIVNTTDDNGVETHTLKVTITGIGNYENTFEYTLPIYRVAFDGDGDAATTGDISVIMITEGLTVYQPQDPVNDNQYATFDGWFAGTDTQAYDFTTPVTSDLEINGRWTIPQYHVTFMNGTDTYSEDDVDAGTTVTRPADPTTPPAGMDNYVFVGWTTEAGDAFDFDNDTITAETTLNASWAPVYSVSFDWDGDPSTTEDRVTVQADPDNAYTVTQPDQPDGTGVLIGWYENEALTGDQIDLTAPVDHDMTLYPAWEP